MSDRQDDWTSWLPLAEFSDNISPSASTTDSPFFACYAFHPRFNALTSASLVPKADEWLAIIHTVQEDLVSSLDFAKSQQARFHNHKRRPADTYSPGDMFWLSRRNLKTCRPCNKLDVRHVGPFAVVNMFVKNAVKLHLSPAFKRLHPVFNLSLITQYVLPIGLPWDSDLPIITSLANDVINESAITQVLQFRCSSSGADEYLLQYSDASGLNDSWTPLSAIPSYVFPALLDFHSVFPYTGPLPLPVLCSPS